MDDDDQGEKENERKEKETELDWAGRLASHRIKKMMFYSWVSGGNSLLAN